MKQKFTLYTMIMILVETVCLLIPGSYMTDNWHPQGYGIWEKLPAQAVNIFELDRVGIEKGPGWWFSIVVMALMVISFAAYVLAFIHPNHKYVEYTYSLPMISFIALIGFTIYACLFAEMAPYATRWEWTIGWLFPVIAILHILTVVFSLSIKHKKYDDITAAVSNKINEVKQEKNIKRAKSNIDPIDEVKKYKELLDAGVITQEEFEAKKTQLLNL